MRLQGQEKVLGREPFFPSSFHLFLFLFFLFPKEMGQKEILL